MKAWELIKHLEEGGLMQHIDRRSLLYKFDGGELMHKHKREDQWNSSTHTLDIIVDNPSLWRVVEEPKKNVVEVWIKKFDEVDMSWCELADAIGTGNVFSENKTTRCKTKVRITVEEIEE